MTYFPLNANPVVNTGVMRTTAGAALVGEWTIGGAVAAALTASNAATSVTYSQTVVSGTGATAGVTTTIQAQAGQQQTGGAANTNGGVLALRGGAAGTGGAGAAGTPGQITHGHGSSLTLTEQLLSSGDYRWTLSSTPSYWVVSAPNASQAIFFQALNAGGNIWFQTPTVSFADQGAALTASWTLNATSTTTFTYAVGVTPVWTQTARTTDAATHDWSITTQAPWASATGTNRNPGNFVVTVPAAASGGTEGKVSFSVSGAEIVNWTNLAAFTANTQTFANTRNAVIWVDQSGNGVAGKSFSLLAGAAGSTGARSAGGQVDIQGGNANGTTGAGAAGGNATLKGGNGSDNSGTGGTAFLQGGTTPSGGGNAGDVALIVGTSGTGAGNNGQMRVGDGSSTWFHIDGRDTTNPGQTHIGGDSDTTHTNLRINGSTATTATAGARTLPANPQDFLIVNINGTERKIPYYAT